MGFFKNIFEKPKLSGKYEVYRPIKVVEYGMQMEEYVVTLKVGRVLDLYTYENGNFAYFLLNGEKFGQYGFETPIQDILNSCVPFGKLDEKATVPQSKLVYKGKATTKLDIQLFTTPQRNSLIIWTVKTGGIVEVYKYPNGVISHIVLSGKRVEPGELYTSLDLIVSYCIQVA